jgi:hypothetical protein
MEEIKVGEKRRIKISFFKHVKLVYCGMPNEHTFSLGYFETTGYQGYALNLYFPKKSSKITIDNIEFNIMGVNQEKINLEPISSL